MWARALTPALPPAPTRPRPRGRAVLCAIAIAAGWTAAACSESLQVLDNRGLTRPNAAGADASSEPDASQPPIDNASDLPEAGLPLDAASGAVDYVLAPENATLAIEHGARADPLQFEVKTTTGRHIEARFQLDDEDLGSIDAEGVFTASGKRAGKTVVEAQVGERILRTSLTVTLHWEQNGASAEPPGAQASGGYGGVGGEGPGAAISDALKATLDGNAKSDSGLHYLYPYDKTVFPLGLLSPLLMWSESGASAADALRLEIQSEYFNYRGYFGRPPPLAAGAAFVRHPIPEDVWEAATRSAAGGGMKIEIVLAKGGIAYGPLPLDLRIASGTLKGTVYYQSYGTNLAKNFSGAKGGDGRFGGATLAIKPGARAPELVAGGDGDESKCRVCHSVSSDGSRMTVQRGDEGYDFTSSYDLRNGYDEMQYSARKQLAWIGMTPDGAYGLGNGFVMGIDGIGSEVPTQLYDMSSGQVVASRGLTDLVSEAAFPMFSHDGRRVAFNFFAGPGNATIGAADKKKLIGMDFDPESKRFDRARVLYQGDKAAGWPTFSPTGNSVIFQIEVKRGKENGFFRTRYGGQGELWWTSLSDGGSHRLEQANGTRMGDAYLPAGGDNHGSDELLNYEPTLAPIASGGYAWMVFTSRRLYGNVATIDPWMSDPRDYDHTKAATTKKLWVAAIDLDVNDPEFSTQVGDDPSHPAFYLPGQELMAGNTRGFWAIDPCKSDGRSCESGVECCTGYCQKDEPSHELSCGRKRIQCAREFDHCEGSKDCCSSEAACINRVCTKLGPS